MGAYTRDIFFVSIIPAIVRRGPVAVYPFTVISKNRDISGYVNPPARFVGRLKYSFGPNKHPQGALYFSGERNTYVLIPNNGCLDTRFSITIAFWVYPLQPGSLVHFNPDGSGMDVSIVMPFKVSVRLISRSGKSVISLEKRIPKDKWTYLTVTSDHKTRLATLWFDSIPFDQRRIDGFRYGFATNYPISIGGTRRGTRRFKGKISCLQIYNYALTKAQIYSKKTRCFSSGVYSELPFLLADDATHHFR